jgi:hypothetical protein
MMCTGSGQQSAKRATFRSIRRESESSPKNLPSLRSTLCLAKKVGTGLGRGEVLQ